MNEFGVTGNRGIPMRGFCILLLALFAGLAQAAPAPRPKESPLTRVIADLKGDWLIVMAFISDPVTNGMHLNYELATGMSFDGDKYHDTALVTTGVRWQWDKRNTYQMRVEPGARPGCFGLRYHPETVFRVHDRLMFRATYVRYGDELWLKQASLCGPQPTSATLPPKNDETLFIMIKQK